jgi:hypothetical protein
MRIIDANEVPFWVVFPFSPVAVTWNLPSSPIYDGWAERHITNVAIGGPGGESTTPTLCFTPCVQFSAKPAGSWVERVELGGSNLTDLRANRGGVLAATYTTQLALGPPSDQQLVQHLYLILLDELERSQDISLYLQLDRMFAECRVAHKTIAAEISNLTAFPVAYQIVDETRPDFVFLAPGRSYDGETPLNHAIGVKVYRGQFAQPGWTTTNVNTAPSTALWYTSQFDNQMLIPWGRERLYLYMIFEKTTTAVTAAKVSFSVVPYSEIK